LRWEGVGAHLVLHVFEGQVLLVQEEHAHALCADGFNPNLIYIHNEDDCVQLIDASFAGNEEAPAGARYFNDASGLFDPFSGAALVNKLEMFKDGTVAMLHGMSAAAVTSLIPWRNWPVYELFISYGTKYWERRAELWHHASVQQ